VVVAAEAAAGEENPALAPRAIIAQGAAGLNNRDTSMPGEDGSPSSHRTEQAAQPHVPSLMDRAVFERHDRSSAREYHRGFIVLVVSQFVSVFPLVVLGYRMHVRILGGTALLGVWCVLVGTSNRVLWWWERRRKKLLLVPCPHCGANLLSIAGRTTLASSRCDECGRVVLSEHELGKSSLLGEDEANPRPESNLLDEPPRRTTIATVDSRAEVPPSSDTYRLMERAELRGNQARWRRSEPPVGVAAVLLFFSPVAAAAVLSRRLDQAGLSGIWAGVTLGWWIALAILFFWLDRKLVRGWRLICEHCGTRLTGPTGEMVMATGRCWRCGRRLLANASEPSYYGPMAHEIGNRVGLDDVDKEVSKRCRDYQSHLLQRLPLHWIVTLVGLLGLMLVPLTLERINVKGFWVNIIFIPLIFGVMLYAVVAPFYWKRSLAKRYGLRCDQCGTLLADSLSAVAAKTGRCGRCGCQLVFGTPGTSIPISVT
jgi:hypothetical protein